MFKLASLVISVTGFIACGIASYPPNDQSHETQDAGHDADVCTDFAAQCSIFGAPCKTVGDCCIGPIKAKCLANACSPDI